MKVTTGTWNPRSNTFSLSGSKVLHDADSAIRLLTNRGYSLDAACLLLMQMKRQTNS